MRIEHHRLSGAGYEEAQHIGGVITPALLVKHDTASRLSRGNAAAYLARNSAKVSVHFVIERDGTVTQQVPTNRRANHAGTSSFHGRAGCNDFSVGVEIVNPGIMTRASASEARAWYGELFDIAQYGIQEVETREHGRGLWMPYTEAQIEADLALSEALFRDIPSLQDMRTHWYVSPGRKIDTNPLYPLEHIRARVLGRDDPADLLAEAGSQPVIPTPADPQMVEIEAPGDTLNLRRWPSFNPNILTTIPDGVAVPVLRKGLFGGRLWLCVQYGGHEGWIVGSYTAPIVFS